MKNAILDAGRTIQFEEIHKVIYLHPLRSLIHYVIYNGSHNIIVI